MESDQKNIKIWKQCEAIAKRNNLSIDIEIEWFVVRSLHPAYAKDNKLFYACSVNALYGFLSGWALSRGFLKHESV